jgi:hypothetical protein
VAYFNMTKELLGDIPGIALPYAQTLVNEALTLIYDEQRWSFQVGENGWLTPGLLGGLPSTLPYSSPGKITVVPYANTIYGDAVATAVWAAMVGRPFITEQQIRVPAYSLYNILNYYAPGDNPNDPTTPFATLIIDRPWMEPAQTNAVYMIYQAYFPVAVPSFKKFGVIRDTTNNAWVNFWQRDQQWLSVNDPQRTVFDIPTYAIPYEVDQRPNSSTLGQMLYELWPHPLSKLPYTYTYIWRGPQLVLPTDTVPYPLNEELLKWRAKEVAFMWKESQKGDGMERGSGADWRFLAQAANAQYGMRLKTVKLLDAGLGDLYWSKFNRTSISQDGYETMIGTLNVGTF